MSDNIPPSKRLWQFRLILWALVAIIFVVFTLVVIKFINYGDSAAYKYDEAIKQANFLCADSNTFCFTDKERTPQKNKGIYRIAVLGDSFIWGSGMPYKQVWSHKLEYKLLAEYDSVEILNWGLPGWSTLDEFNFLKTYGKGYGIDLLIVGWVANDPDMGNMQRIILLPVKDEFPTLFKICPPLARIMLNVEKNIQYFKWMNAIYKQQNLNAYQKLLIDFHTYTIQNRLQTLFVMTPGPFEPSPLDWRARHHFKTVERLIANAGFPCLNLYDSVKKKMQKYSRKQQMANPVNSHPGNLMTEEFAIEVKAYLEQNGYLKQLRKQQL